MDALTQLNIILLVLSTALLAMACVPADRVRAWRAGINPSAQELSDVDFVIARILLVVMAGVGIYMGAQVFHFSADESWNDSELTSAVRQATDDLDGYSYHADQEGIFFDDYGTLIEDKVTRYGGEDVPQSDVDAAPAYSNTDTDAHFTVTASGVETAFCMHIERIRSKADDYTPPGIGGGEGTVTFPGYRLAVTTRKGDC